MNESAFPTSNWQKMVPHSNGYSEGMTLRDYFAAKAMQELVGVFNPTDGTKKAYEWADAMLKARQK
jgi:hypothetical protein